MPRTPGTFYSRLVANPAVCEWKGTLYYVFRGQDERGHDQLGCWVAEAAVADGVHWSPLTSGDRVVVPVSDNTADCDASHVLDPALVEAEGRLQLFYTAKNNAWQPNNSLAWAVFDGLDFVKRPTNPVLRGASAPELVKHEGQFYLFFQRASADDRRWQVYLRVASTLEGLQLAHEEVVFGPSGLVGSPDEVSVTTCRIVQDNGYFYLTYGACTRFLDYPESFCLARSTNLRDWERYPGNPILHRGEAGGWDEGALWYPTVRRFGSKLLLWYEGAGAGMGLTTAKARAASQRSREQDYGGYLVESFSQIGLAEADDWPAW